MDDIRAAQPWMQIAVEGDLVNVGSLERMAAAVVGGALALTGLRRRSFGGALLMLAGGGLLYRGVTGHCYLYGSLGINTAATRSPATGVRAQHGYKVERSIAVQRPASELYRFWRDLENLPRIMEHLVSVSSTGGYRSHWVAKGLLGTTLEWDAEIINERADELIAWRSLEGAEVDTAGSVHFQALPGDRGTLVKVSMKYDPPAGKAGATIAAALGEGLERRLDADLRRFKQVMEAGEAPVGRP